MTNSLSKDDAIYTGINADDKADVHLAPESGNTCQLTKSANETFPLPLVLSAQSECALQQLAADWQSLLEREDVNLNELSKYAATSRPHLKLRAAVAATDKLDAILKLSDLAAGIPHPHVVKSRREQRSTHKVAFVFSGQGPQWYAMGRELLNTDDTFRCTIEEINDRLKSLGWLARYNSSLLEELQMSEDDSRMNLTEIAQPALFALQVGLARIWQRLGVEPDMVVGHSIGEVAAAYISGAISMEDAVKIVYWRSVCQVPSVGRGRMMAAGLTVDNAGPLLAKFNGKIDIAAVNGAAMLTLAGDSDALSTLSQVLRKKKIFNRFLIVDVPFHSYLLDDVAADFGTQAPQLEGTATRIPLYSTVSGDLAQGSDIDRDYWSKNIRDTVKFYPTVKKMVNDGASVFVEISPHPILSHGIRQALEATRTNGVVVPSLRRKDAEKLTLTRSLSSLYVHGVPLEWNHIFSRVADKDFSLPTP